MRRWLRATRLQTGPENADDNEVTTVATSSSAVAPEPGPADGLRRRRLFGLRLIDAESLDPILEAVLARDRTPDPDTLSILVTPNVDIVVMLDQRPDSPEAEIFRRARYVLPDGMPLVASSSRLGQPLRARLTGSGLFEILWPRLAAEQRSTIVVCADEELRRRLAESYPEATFIVPPIFDATSPDELGAVADSVIGELGANPAEFVLIGMGHPKDALLGEQVLKRWPQQTPIPLVLGLGGSFAMYAGLTKRAPEFVQRIGAEWLYRFIQEPRRLFTRYFVRDAAFLGVLWREYRGMGRIQKHAPR